MLYVICNMLYEEIISIFLVVANLLPFVYGYGV